VLSQLVPGQSFSPTALRRYDRKHRIGLKFQSQLTPKPGPQEVGYDQPAWRLIVNFAPENNQHLICSGREAADRVAIPTKRGRVDDEHATYWRGRADRWLPFLCFPGNNNIEMLSNEKFSNSYLDVFRIWFALTPNPNPLPPKSERNQ
jgi:hypothetical protein